MGISQSQFHEPSVKNFKNRRFFTHQTTKFVNFAPKEWKLVFAQRHATVHSRVENAKSHRLNSHKIPIFFLRTVASIVTIDCSHTAPGTRPHWH
jgi:hypothetical protein